MAIPRDVEKRSSADTGTVITNPQVGIVGNSRRQSTWANGPADGFRHILIGYVRVSTADQNPDHQIDALLRAGVDRNNTPLDTESGAKAPHPGLDLVMQLLRERGTLKVTRLDRLSRVRPGPVNPNPRTTRRSNRTARAPLTANAGPTAGAPKRG
ncbi:MULTISPECIES: recombinase family protein [unclassified Streptomyces]|uniref:recombinase family protein n=1 Tax=unclassified Streptomyces TaxID=2593676 RepID=UPI002E3398B9|nr:MULTISPECIES: recombinase family protein [unclassified Streptomyces]WUC68366.1 recombinase family protein [Streptomyces sp. NBC_00539]